jgi:hypothetical protein
MLAINRFGSSLMIIFEALALLCILKNQGNID